jgi:nitrogen-specific signal transduction histidine kinase
MISVFCGTILISTHLRNKNVTGEILEKTANDIERIDRPLTVHINFNVRAFAMYIDNENNITYFPTRNYTAEEIHDYFFNYHLDGSATDNIEFYEKTTQNGKIIVGVDTTIENEAFKNLLIVTLSMGGGALAVLLVIAWFLSFWVVSPAKVALEKQQRFITEASHELRTPLTVISTGIDLLNAKRHTGDTKQLIDSIKGQTERMNVMTTDLLTLSQLDEKKKTPKQQFNLWQVVAKEVLLFESVAFEQGKEIANYAVGGNFMYRGDPDAVKQAVGILLDNAIKHSCRNANGNANGDTGNANGKANGDAGDVNDNATGDANNNTAGNANGDTGDANNAGNAKIKVIVSKTKNRHILLSVENECDLDAAEVPYIFERFYRGKESRAKTVGTGLGLSILKTIGTKQGWKTDARLHDGQIVFSILF